MNNRWWEIDIYGCYSLVKITFVPIGTCKNKSRIWRHNACTPRSRVVTDQLLQCHNAKSEKTVLRDNCEMRDRWFVFSGIMCSGYKIVCKKLNNTFVALNDNFWVTNDAICQWFSLVTVSLLKIIGKSAHSWPKNCYIHGNSCIIFISAWHFHTYHVIFWQLYGICDLSVMAISNFHNINCQTGMSVYIYNIWANYLMSFVRWGGLMKRVCTAFCIWRL